MRDLGVRFANTLDLVDRGPVAVVNGLVPECDAIYLLISMCLTWSGARYDAAGTRWSELPPTASGAGRDRATRSHRGVRHRRIEPADRQFGCDCTNGDPADRTSAQRAVRLTQAGPAVTSAQPDAVAEPRSVPEDSATKGAFAYPSDLERRALSRLGRLRTLPASRLTSALGTGGTAIAFPSAQSVCASPKLGRPDSRVDCRSWLKRLPVRSPRPSGFPGDSSVGGTDDRGTARA